jgi:hypothetical protein
MTMDFIDTFTPFTGRTLREDGSIVNRANIASRTGIEIARGNYPGAANIASYGELTTTGAVTNHLIWPPAGLTDLTVPPAPGQQITLVSTSADDATGGTGIQSITILYLDGSLNSQSEVVPLSGLTPKTTTATDVRFIQCMYASAVGSGKAAAGDISATYGAGIVHSYIPTGSRRCASSARRVPAGKRLIISGMAASAISGTAAARAEIRLVATGIFGDDFTEDAITFPYMAVGAQDTSEALSNVFFAVPEGLVVGFEVTCDKGATISASFMGWTEDV